MYSNASNFGNLHYVRIDVFIKNTLSYKWLPYEESCITQFQPSIKAITTNLVSTLIL